MFLVGVLGVLSFLGVLRADYDCLCSYNVEKPVQSKVNLTLVLLNSDMQFLCKQFRFRSVGF